MESQKGGHGESVSKGSAITIDNLTVKYANKTVLDHFSLSVKSGENVIIAGPNGCGKTTLLKALMGMVRPDGGTIEITDRRKGSIAYCGQEKASSDFLISVREVLKLGIPATCSSDQAKHRIQEALGMTHCTSLENRNFFSLSGGEKQRVSIARCLCQDPSLILLDEPSTYLDSSGKDELFAILDRLAKSPLTILMVTHEAELFEHFATWNRVQLPKVGV